MKKASNTGNSRETLI